MKPRWLFLWALIVAAIVFTSPLLAGLACLYSFLVVGIDDAERGRKHAEEDQHHRV